MWRNAPATQSVRPRAKTIRGRCGRRARIPLLEMPSISASSLSKALRLHRNRGRTKMVVEYRLVRHQVVTASWPMCIAASALITGFLRARGHDLGPRRIIGGYRQPCPAASRRLRCQPSHSKTKVGIPTQLPASLLRRDMRVWLRNVVKTAFAPVYCKDSRVGRSVDVYGRHI